VRKRRKARALQDASEGRERIDAVAAQAVIASVSYVRGRWGPGYRLALAVFVAGACLSVAGAKCCVDVLFLEPAQEFLVARVGLDFFDGVEVVAELVVGPGFVDEIFAGTAGRRGFASAFATRDHVVFAGGDVAIAEGALFRFGLGGFFGHSFGGNEHIINWCSWKGLHLHLRRSRRRASAIGLHEQENWYARPVTLRIPALI
jgi:hypothetical protein